MESMMPTYAELLQRAETLDTPEAWAPVLAMEDDQMQQRIAPSLRGPEGARRLSEYLIRNPQCGPCEARGLQCPAIGAVRVVSDAGDEDGNLVGVCHNCLYVQTARALGWPVRGYDVGGNPSDPDHPWNSE